MQQNAYQGIPGLPSPSTKDHKPFIDLIVMASQWAHQHKNAPPAISDPVADFIIYISFLVTQTEWWIHAFTEAQKTAAHFYRDPNTYWRAIAFGVLSPEVQRVVSLCLPNLDQGKYFPITDPTPTPQKITPKATPTPKKKTITSPRVRRGLKWKLNNRWAELSPLDRKIFFEGCRRAQKPKREGGFPWAELGVESLSKKIRAPIRQVKRSRFHLCELGLWSRIKRGYKDQGASKYSILITPKMADAFFWKHSLKAKPQAS